MTTTPPPFDELVSAYLDGEATADEIARVEASPELRAEVRRLEALTGRIAHTDSVSSPPTELREAHLAAALAAFDAAPSAQAAVAKEPAGQTEPAVLASRSDSVTSNKPDKSDKVVSLDQRRHRRSLPDGNVLGIAAAIALFVLGAAALFSFTGGGGDRFETADAVSDAVDSASESSSDAASDTSESVVVEAQGSFADDDAVADDSSAQAEPEVFAADEEAMEEEEEQTTGAEASAAPSTDFAESEDAAADERANPAATAQPFAAGFEMFLDNSDIDPDAGRAYWLGPTEQLEQVPPLLNARALAQQTAPRTRCQLETPGLDSSATPTLLGLTIVDGTAFEVHGLPNSDTAVVLDARTCEIVNEFPLE